MSSLKVFTVEMIYGHCVSITHPLNLNVALELVACLFSDLEHRHYDMQSDHCLEFIFIRQIR